MKRLLLFFPILFFCACHGSMAAAIELVPDHAGSEYRLGETAVVAVLPEAVPGDSTIRIREFHGKQLVSETSFPAGKREFAVSADRPGVVKVMADVLDASGNVTASRRLALLFDREQIRAARSAPGDFHSRWDAEVRLARAFPIRVSCVREKSFDRPGIEGYKVVVDNLDGTKLYGGLGVPAAPGKYPALLCIPGAGPATVDPSGMFQEGFLTWFMNVHAYEPQGEENELQRRYGGDYIYLADKPLEENFFRRAWLGFVIATRWLKTHEKFDGENLGVLGHSQGGGSTIVMAGLMPGDFKFAVAAQPAFGNCGGEEPGWPFMAFSRTEEKLRQYGYIDTANFAERIRCPVIVICGLVDDACPPGSVISIFNRIPGEKELVIENAPHSWTPGTNDALGKMKDRLRKAGN